jgi:hypothetical protein
VAGTAAAGPAPGEGGVVGWLTFSITWGMVSAFIGIHVLLIFMIGIRFVTPYSMNARVIQHTIQLIPRCPSRCW